MKSPFHTPLAALGLLAFLTNCASTVAEKEKPSSMSQPMEAPAATGATRPDSAGATAATRAATLPAAPPIVTGEPVAATTTDASVPAGADTLPNNAVLVAPTAAAASAERAKEKKMTVAEYRAMLAKAEAAVKANPKDGTAFLQRAKAKSYLKQYEAALPDYTAALRYQRTNPDAFYNRGVNRLMMKQYKLASADFSGALKYRPDDKESFFGRGVARMQMYQYKPAVADFTRAIQLDSTYADAWEYRGISYSSFEKLSEARHDLERAAKLNPEAAKSLRRYVGNEGKAPIKAPAAKPVPRPAAIKR